MIIEIRDGEEAFIPVKRVGANGGQPYLISGSLDMFGDITLTGNLIVQQSQWVYLRGPVTSSAALINGPITASNLLIRKSRGDGETNSEWGNVEVEGNMVVGGVNLLDKIAVLEEKVTQLEKLAETKNNSVKEYSNSIEYE